MIQKTEFNQELIIDSGMAHQNNFSGISAEIMNKLLFENNPIWLTDVILSIEHRKSNGKLVKCIKVLPKKINN